MSPRPAPHSRHRALRLAGLVAAVLSAAIISGCAQPTAPTAPAGVSVSVEQGRTDVAAGMMSIKVHNDGADPVRVTSASYHDLRFADTAEWGGDALIPAGSARDLRVTVPDAACDVGDDPETGAAPDSGTAHVEFSTEVGPASAEYAVDDPHDFVPAFTEAACFTARLSDTATLELADVSTRTTGDGEVAVLEIAVDVHGDDPVLIESVNGTVLLGPAHGEPSWPLATTVEPGDSTSLRVEAVPTRCDAHAIAEDKVGTRFRTTVSILGAPAANGEVTLVATDEQRGELHDFVAARCQ